MPQLHKDQSTIIESLNRRDRQREKGIHGTEQETVTDVTKPNSRGK